MHPRYKDWIRHVFDHDVGETPWYFDVEAPNFALSDEDVALLMTETFSRAGRDLCEYSDAQVNQGLWYLASPSASDYMFSIRNGKSSFERKREAIQSIHRLYRDCFAERCTEVLGHADEAGASDLNSICYMFWDICPLSCLEEATDRPQLEDAIFSVLEDTIRIPHRACIEAGLHGLGEMAYRYEERVSACIDRFLAAANRDASLAMYAQRARVGAIL